MSVCRVTAQANTIGESSGVVCRYEWDRKKGVFRWNYYRRGRFVGGTSTMTKVIPMMTRLVTVK